MSWKRFVQHQKPMAAMLTALLFPLAAGIYNFGWRVLAVVGVACLTCWCGEYLFTRKRDKPASMAALVTAVLLALVLPPRIPLWMVVLGSAMAIVFGKMVFGGFGKNIFNPALVGRCFLYVSFPIYMTANWSAATDARAAQGGWVGPVPGSYGGLVTWVSAVPVHEIDGPVDGVSSATALTAAKMLNQAAAVEETREAAREAFADLSVARLAAGRISGSMGETSAVAILLGLCYLLYRKAVIWQLVLSPLVGLAAGTALLAALGAVALPLGGTLLTNIFGGGTLFACVFMTTEPVSAPMNGKARWIYGILIGLFAAVIRTLSVFNAGLMFSILLGNMFGPIIEHLCVGYEKARKAKGGNAGA